MGARPNEKNPATKLGTHGKHGPWSEEDKKYIEDNHQLYSVDVIAKSINRNPRAVANYIKKHFKSSYHASAKTAEYDIKSSPVWKDLKRQFTAEELEMFIFHWSRIISQFKDDVYPTEQMQVVDTVKLDILMNRCLTDQHKCLSEIKQHEKDLMNERLKHEADQDRNLIFHLEKQIGILRASQESLNDSYQDMLQKKNAILKEMKATRDARIKNIESYKHSFSSWIIRLIENKGLRQRLGEEMEKMRVAMDAEYERLSDYHIYADGVADQPFLTPESVK